MVYVFTSPLLLGFSSLRKHRGGAYGSRMSRKGCLCKRRGGKVRSRHRKPWKGSRFFSASFLPPFLFPQNCRYRLLFRVGSPCLLWAPPKAGYHISFSWSLFLVLPVSIPPGYPRPSLGGCRPDSLPGGQKKGLHRYHRDCHCHFLPPVPLLSHRVRIISPPPTGPSPA